LAIVILVPDAAVDQLQFLENPDAVVTAVICRNSTSGFQPVRRKRRRIGCCQTGECWRSTARYPDRIEFVLPNRK
jgi:hypothetical protein